MAGSLDATGQFERSDLQKDLGQDTEAAHPAASSTAGLDARWAPVVRPTSAPPRPSSR
jgi:hypothetical protein